MRWRVNFLSILCGPTDFSSLPVEGLFFTAIEFEKEKERRKGDPYEKFVLALRTHRCGEQPS